MEGWEARLHGDNGDAWIRFESARELAAVRGFRVYAGDEAETGQLFRFSFEPISASMRKSGLGPRPHAQWSLYQRIGDARRKEQPDTAEE